MLSIQRATAKGFLLLLIVLFPNHIFSQCAMCKAVIENDSSVAEGINNGIIYLMAIPYLLLVVIGYLIYNHYNKTKKT